MSVETAVEHELEGLGDLADTALAATALALAAEIDDPENSATSKASCARELRDTMAALKALAPPEEKKGPLDDIKSGRALRLVEGKSTT